MLEDIENPKAIMDRLLTVDETASILGISRATLYTWICRKKIEVVKIGSRALFDPAYIKDYIKKHTVRTISYELMKKGRINDRQNNLYKASKAGKADEYR